MEFIERINNLGNNSSFRSNSVKIRSKFGQIRSNLTRNLIELLEPNLFSVLPKESSTNAHVVFSDDTIMGPGNSATSAAFSASSRVRVPDVLVSHFCCLFFCKFDSH